MTNKHRFYKKGVRFECRGCGQCCATEGEYQDIYLTRDDLKRLAGYLKTSVAKFKKRYVEKFDGEYYLKTPGTDCVFMKEKGCSVYEARPGQCRTWPFWPENMTRKVWEEEVKARCPGVGKGRIYSAGDIELIIKQGKDVTGVQ